MDKLELRQLRDRLLRDEKVQQMIRVRAYEIYQMRGHSPGGPADDWLQAEGEVLAFLIANEPVQGDQRETFDKSSIQGKSRREAAPSAKKKPRRPSAGKTAGSKRSAQRDSPKPPAKLKSKPKRTRKPTRIEDKE